MVLYKNLLVRVETSFENARMESFGKAYARCQEDFDTLLHGSLSDLDPVLASLQHLFADFERRVTLMEDVRSIGRGAAETSPAGVHREMVASSEQSDKIHFTVAALGRVNQGARVVSTRVATVHKPAPPGAGHERHSPPWRGRRLSYLIC